MELELLLRRVRLLHSEPRFVSRRDGAAFLLGLAALEMMIVFPVVAALYTLACARPHFKKVVPLFVDAPFEFEFPLKRNLPQDIEVVVEVDRNLTAPPDVRQLEIYLAYSKSVDRLKLP